MQPSESRIKIISKKTAKTVATIDNPTAFGSVPSPIIYLESARKIPIIVIIAIFLRRK
jgi:hypothetical protein